MQVFMLVMKLMPLVAQAISMVEEAGRDGIFTSQEKKDLALMLLKTAFTAMPGISTGGQAEFWRRAESQLGVIVDALVAILFPHKEG